MKWSLLGGVLGPFNPQILLNFLFSHKEKTLFEQSLCLFMFVHKQNVPKFYSFGLFLGPIYPLENQKYCQKPKFLQKLHLQNCQTVLTPGPKKITVFL